MKLDAAALAPACAIGLGPGGARVRGHRRRPAGSRGPGLATSARFAAYCVPGRGASRHRCSGGCWCSRARLHARRPTRCSAPRWRWLSSSCVYVVLRRTSTIPEWPGCGRSCHSAVVGARRATPGVATGPEPSPLWWSWGMGALIVLGVLVLNQVAWAVAPLTPEGLRNPYVDIPYQLSLVVGPEPARARPTCRSSRASRSTTTGSTTPTWLRSGTPPASSRSCC